MNDKHNSKTNPATALALLCIAAFLVPFMGSAINLALPQISNAFSMKAVTLTWMATAYLISTAIFQIPFARIADIVGRKKIFLSGVAAFTICSLFSGMATSAAMLLGLRFLAGIGSAMMFGTNIAIITSLFPPEKRGMALGINAAVVYAALAAGPFLGGILTHYLGWQSIFYFSAAVGVIVIVLSLLFLKGEWIESKGEAFDIKGSILYGLGIAGLIYGFSSLPLVNGIVCLAAGIVSLVVFGIYEMKIPSPVLNLRFFSGNRIFTLSSLAALINYAATSAIAFMLSLYLQYIRGLEPTQAGFILISQACVQSVFSLLSGKLSAKFHPSTLATAGMVIVVAGLGGLSFVGIETPFWFIIMLLALLGIGFGIFSAPNTTVIMGSVDKKDYSSASATTGTVRLTGQAFSMGIAGMAVSFHIGGRQIVPEVFPDYIASMRTTFMIFFVLCCVGIYASMARGKAIR